ncbi:tyrosine-type recombinase/integrase [Agrobacterium pusense]|uniref:Tyrosine-type recombinase/integrase n=1 Tax=Agrobacterium pusense TaxID=648995 RepID=A0A6H0ZQW7_9HYPH|nr:tyrosine-type recombinase/integrase [Agrobacterium pusense]QIX22404.1 tyrosine-type recombinase/integrase [Agrobacterium pusense]
MASFKVSITQHFMRSFLHDPFSAGDRIYTDIEAKGLELRVQGNRASWIARYKGKLMTLGYAVVPDPKKELRMLTSGAEARDLNTTVRSLMDRDWELVKPFLANYYKVSDKHGRRDILKTIEEAEKSLARARGEEAHAAAWTFRQAIDNWIEKRNKPDNKKPIKDTYAAEVRSVVGRSEFSKVIDLPITKLTSGMAEDIRDSVLKNSGVSMAKKAVGAFRKVLGYTFDKHRGNSGLEGSQPWWLMLTEDSVINPRDREPSIEDIGKVLALGEYFLDHRLPGRTGVQHGVRDNVFAAFVWIVMSTQRVSSALALRYEDVQVWAAEGKEGWHQAMWREGVMKNRKRFVLPIPPLASDTLNYYMMKAKHLGSKWAFPSEDGYDAQIDRSAPLNFIKRLAGRDDKMKDDERAVDLLELNGIKYWSPHDVRRALTTAMEEAGMPGGASVVLSHTIDLGEPEKKMTEAQFEVWARNRVAKITGQSYGDIQHLKLKGEAMLLWTNAILAAWNHARNNPIYVDVGKTVIVSDLAGKWEPVTDAA